jgi:phenylpropionate dioxygenase-like ring-hydroxylating dioxygenase large terminal subunit
VTDIPLADMSLCDHPALHAAGHAVLRDGDVGEAPVAVELLGRAYVVWRDGAGALAAAVDRCPHRESPLSVGAVVDGRLECPYHGWRFEGDGRCSLVPSSGPGSAVPPRARLESIGVEQRYGLIWLCPAGTAASPLPDIPEDADPAYRRINVEVATWNASVGRLVDNFLDFAHFPWVHRGSFGGAADPVVPPLHLGPLGDFFGYAYGVEAANPADAVGASGQDTDTVERAMTTGFRLPFLVRSDITYRTGLRHVILLCSAPVDDDRSAFTFVIWRNDDHSVPAEDVIRLDRQIGQEDRRMLERVRGPLPLSATTLVNVAADKASVEWRRQLRVLLAGSR